MCTICTRIFVCMHLLTLFICLTPGEIGRHSAPDGEDRVGAATVTGGDGGDCDGGDNHDAREAVRGDEWGVRDDIQWGEVSGDGGSSGGDLCGEWRRSTGRGRQTFRMSHPRQSRTTGGIIGAWPCAVFTLSCAQLTWSSSSVLHLSPGGRRFPLKRNISLKRVA